MPGPLVLGLMKVVLISNRMAAGSHQKLNPQSFFVNQKFI
jgi:hypothetical protein